MDVLLLDKTGTITLGNRQATAFLPAAGVTESDLADAAQLASLADETPEGRSIVVLAKERYQLRQRDLAHGGGEAQAKAHALVGGFRERAEGELGQVLAPGQVVHVHQLDGAGAEDALAVGRQLARTDGDRGVDEVRQGEGRAVVVPAVEGVPVGDLRWQGGVVGVDQVGDEGAEPQATSSRKPMMAMASFPRSFPA